MVSLVSLLVAQLLPEPDPAPSPMEILTLTHQFYEDAFSNLLWTLGFTFGVIGTVLGFVAPLVIDWVRRRSLLKDFDDRVAAVRDSVKTGHAAFEERVMLEAQRIAGSFAAEVTKAHSEYIEKLLDKYEQRVDQVAFSVSKLENNSPEAARLLLQQLKRLKPDEVQAAFLHYKAYELLDLIERSIEDDMMSAMTYLDAGFWLDLAMVIETHALDPELAGRLRAQELAFKERSKAVEEKKMRWRIWRRPDVDE